MSTNVKDLIIKSGSAPDQQIQIPTIVIPKKMRVIQALKSLAMCWAIAVGAVFIPVLHFVLVPFFILAGLFFALNSYSDEIMLDDTELKCAGCDFPVQLKDRKDQFPKWFTCDNCKTEFEMVPAPTSATAKIYD